MFGAMAELFDLHWVMIRKQALTASVLPFSAFVPFHQPLNSQLSCTLNTPALD